MDTEGEVGGGEGDGGEDKSSEEKEFLMGFGIRRII